MTQAKCIYCARAAWLHEHPIPPPIRLAIRPPTFYLQGRMPQARGLIQAYQFRDFAASEARALQEAEAKTLQERFARARALRDLAAVWESTTDRIRIMRGRGLPKSVEARNAKPKGKRPQPTAPIALVSDVAPTPHPSLPANVTPPESS